MLNPMASMLIEPAMKKSGLDPATVVVVEMDFEKTKQPKSFMILNVATMPKPEAGGPQFYVQGIYLVDELLNGDENGQIIEMFCTLREVYEVIIDRLTSKISHNG